jgi:hypothetical protein
VPPESAADTEARGLVHDGEPTPEHRELASAADHDEQAPTEEPKQEPTWSDRFASPEEMFEAFRNVDRLRGRQANEIGVLRAQISDLLLRLEERDHELAAYRLRDVRAAGHPVAGHLARHLAGRMLEKAKAKEAAGA